MRALAGLILVGGVAFCAAPAASTIDASTQSVLNRAPLRFENIETDHIVPDQWIARGIGFAIQFNGDSVLLDATKEAVRLQFVGANLAEAKDGHFTGEQKSTVRTNHFGRNSHSSDAFLKLRRREMYPGIDVTYYGVGQSLEYDFELAPGADPSKIRLRFYGANQVSVTDDGSLRVSLPSGDIVQRAPVTYQRMASGEVMAVHSSYVPEDDGTYSVRLGEYDASRKLVIDPQVLFTAYLAGSGTDSPLMIGRDQNNSIYLAGATFSRDFPLTGDTFSGFVLTPNEHIFTTKMNPLGTGDSVIPYSGIFGGSFGDMLKAATVDSQGVFYLTGLTDDFYFPTTPNGYSLDNGLTRKMFVSVLDTKIPDTAGLTYSTFFGGTAQEEPTSVAVSNGLIYMTGFTFSTDYPVLNPIEATLTQSADIFTAVFDPSKSGTASLLQSGYLGGSFYDVPKSIVIDAAGKAYVAGYTYSYDLGATPDAFQPSYNGGGDGFLARLDLLGAHRVEYLTYLGTGAIDQAWKVLLDAQGHAVVAGFTLADAGFPTTANAMQPFAAGGGDAFITVLDLTKSGAAQLVYSTLYGGSGGEVINDMRIGPSGAYYICGYTLSRDLPTADALHAVSAGGGTDGFAAIIDPTIAGTSGLTYSSYITGAGFQMAIGIEVDPIGNIYVTGAAFGNVFDPGQDVPPDGSGTNVFLLVFRPSPPPVQRTENTVAPTNTRTRR